MRHLVRDHGPSSGTPADARVYRVDAFRIDSFEMVGERMKLVGHMSRTGVQEYDQGDGTVRREQRDAAEVFSAESLRSLEVMPVTVGHPERVMLDGDNWRDFSVGVVGSNVAKAKDGRHTEADIWVLDADTQRDIRDRRLQELSIGYFAGLDETAGVNDAGERYDARQVNIRGNHLALLPSGHARGGPTCRLFLDSKGDATFQPQSSPRPNPAAAPSGAQPAPVARRDTMKFSMMIGGAEQEIELPDEVVSAIAGALAPMVVEKIQAKMAEEEGDMKEPDAGEPSAEGDPEKMDAVKAQLDAVTARADKLQAQLDAFTPERLASMADARAALVAKADLVAGKKIDSRRLSDGALKRAALEQAGIKLDGQSNAYIEARFDLEAEASERAIGSLSTSRQQSRGDVAEATIAPSENLYSIDAARSAGGF